MFQRYTTYHGFSSCSSITDSNRSVYFCGNRDLFVPNSSSYRFRRWVLHEISLSFGESFIIYASNSSGSKLSPLWSIVGPYSGSADSGCIDCGSNFVIEIIALPSSGKCVAPDGYSCIDCPDCSDDSDCASGEKCVEGVCVPCEKIVDGKGIVTLWGVNSDGTILSDGLSVDISSGVSSVNLSNFSPGLLTAGRIQIFNGMSGTLTVKAGIGILGSDFGANVTLFSGAVSGHYQDFLFDAGNLPFGYSFNGKVTFEILNYDTLGDCADDIIDNTPDDVPIDLVDGGEPESPSGSGPGTVTAPSGSNTIIKVIVIKPTPPETGCDCEKYLVDALYSGFDSLGNRLVELTNSFDLRLSEQNSLIHSFLSDQNRILFEQLSESNRLSYELSLFFARKFYPQLLKMTSSLESLSSDVSLIKDFIESISDDLSDIRDSLRLEPCEPDYPDGKTIAEIADDFEKHYYPATVEVLESDVVLDTGFDEPDIFCRKLRK